MLKKKIKNRQSINLQSSIFNLQLKSGFTLIEVLIATMILIILITFSVGVYTNFYNSYRNLKASNLVYQEGRFVTERIIQEIRNGTVDYEEYFDKSSATTGTSTTYGDNYCQYSRQFYSSGTDGKFGTGDDKNTGRRINSDPNDPNPPAAINQNIQHELYLIDGTGTKRTLFKRIVSQDSQENPIGQIGILKLIGKDYGLNHLEAGSTVPKDEGEGDGLVDTWECEKEFLCPVQRGSGLQLINDSSFVSITPNNLDVVDIQFIIAPQDDPRKGFNMPEIQIQPHVTVKLSVRAGKRIAQSFKSGTTPNITLESTISSRVYSEVAAQCPLKECIDGEQKACPKTLGVCVGTMQTCTGNVWPGCTNGTYTAQSAQYRARELSSTNPEVLCKDGVDNDCNGLADEFDPECISKFFCKNSIKDTGLAHLNTPDSANIRPEDRTPLDLNAPNNQDEKSIDVGGICKNINPLEPLGSEVSCKDGLDNDNNDKADEFDQNCINQICNNSTHDRALAGLNYTPKNYIVQRRSTPPANIPVNPNTPANNQNELRVDIGGLCSRAIPPHNAEGRNNETSCEDGLDNDGFGGRNGLPAAADEFDLNCIRINRNGSICRNDRLDCGLAPSSFRPIDNLTGYSDPSCTQTSDQDEVCVDAGGVCGSVAETSVSLCTDGIDNNCNNSIDFRDRDCCPDIYFDRDADGFKAQPATPNGKCQPPANLIDCDDTPTTGALIHPPQNPLLPRAKEIERGDKCYDNQDNDCSGLSDSQTPSCCTDLDGDNFGDRVDVGNGVLQYNLAQCPGTEIIRSRLLAQGRAAADIAPQTHPELYWDCNDTPGNSGSNAINPNQMEICDDGIDNNCNRLTDLEDNYCQYGDQMTFVDNLSGPYNKYKLTSETTALWNLNDSGEIVPPTPIQGNQNTQGPFVATSTVIPTKVGCSVARATLKAETVIPTGTSISYQLSNREENNRPVPIWENAVVDEELRFGTASASRLRWKATLIGDTGSPVPELKSVTISYVCQP